MAVVVVGRAKIDASHLVGKFLDESHYDTVIDYDCDGYQLPECTISDKSDCTETDCSKCQKVDTTNEKKIAFKFRKNYFTQEEQDGAYAGLRKAAQQSQNRGLAAGPKGVKLQNRDWVTDEQLDILEHMIKKSGSTLMQVDEIDEIREQYKVKTESSTRGMVWLRDQTKGDGFKFEEWLKEARNLPFDQRAIEAKRVLETYVSDTTYANPVFSGIAGWFDRYPRIPYARATSYTEKNFDDFKLAFPFLQSLNRGFKDLLPWRWGNQKNEIDKIDPAFVVPGTVFTTITVNKNFRTAAHLDAGDYADGLSNLLVLTNNGKYKGGYLVFPEYRIAVDVRPGDLLLVNNHEVIHGNTPIELEQEDAERISLVCYLREGLRHPNIGEKAYEDLRYKFVEHRRHDKENKLWWSKWNGISANCFSDKSDGDQDWEAARDWYDFLKKNDGEKYLDKYHPWLKAHFEHSLENILFG